MERCDWCHKKDENLIEKRFETTDRFGLKSHEKAFYVHPGCESDLKNFLKRMVMYGKVFVACMVGSSLAIVLFSIIIIGWSEKVGLSLIGADIFFIGIVIYLFPFATPETVQLIGYKKARLLGKGLSTLLILSGPLLIVYALYQY